MTIPPVFGLPSTLGFRNADVCRFWLLFSVVGCIVQLLMLVQGGTELSYSVEALLRLEQPWKLLLLRLCPPRFEELICTSVLVYLFRNLERRLGSKKFANFLLITFGLSAVFEFACIKLLFLAATVKSQLLISVGPYSSLAGCFLHFYVIFVREFVNNLNAQSLCTLLYVVLQSARLMSIGYSECLAILCGMLVTVLYMINVFRMQRWALLGHWTITFLSLFSLSSGEASHRGSLMVPMGATAAAQRQHFMEWSENYNIVNRMMAQYRRDAQSRSAPLPVSERWFRSVFGGGGGGGTPHTSRSAASSGGVHVSDEHVDTLVSMGFSNRQRVVDVLRDVNDDLNVAALVLSQRVDNVR